MSTAKLTLSVPQQLLAQAKAYSKRTRQPLSRLVARYFAVLSGREAESEISPRVRRVTGLAKSERHEKDLLLDALAHKYRLKS